MRISLVLHAFTPVSRTGVEVYTESLARALVARGHQVEILAPRPDKERPYLTQERIHRDGFGVTWLSFDPAMEDEDRRRAAPGADEALQRFLVREQPQVVHFQHLLGFPCEALDLARDQDCPVLFTAHDGFAVSDDYTLLAPDLSALEPGDFEAAARSRLARGVLDRELCSHDGFLVPGDASAELIEAVSRVLADGGEYAGQVPLLARRIREGVRQRLSALSRVDHLEAPTRFLAQTLRQAGLRREVEVRSCGIDVSRIQSLDRSRRRAGEPLRVLYLGGYYEHKGVHVLLQACEGLQGQVQLNLRGCAGSSSYSRVLCESAERCGAELGGAFDRQELPGLLANSDLLVLPSLWTENAPFVLREAFSAGLPVLASDSPALRESVKDGVDGLLLAAGDVSAWRAGLERCAGDRAFLDSLTAGVRPPKTIEEDAQELEERYEELVSEFADARSRGLQQTPAHLWEFARRHQELAALPTRVLLQRAAAGLEQRGLPKLPSAASLVQLFEAGAGARERLAEAAREKRWRDGLDQNKAHSLEVLEQRVGDLELSAKSERERAEWNESLLAERDERLGWQEQRLASQERELEALRAEIDLGELTRTSLEAELGLAARTTESDRSELELAQATLVEMQGRVVEHRSRLESLTKELSWTRECLEDRQAHLEETQGARAAELATGEAIRVELAATLEGLRAAHDELQRDRLAAREHEQFLQRELVVHLERLKSLDEELAWRREEMRSARKERGGVISSILDRQLSKRLKEWERLEGGAVEEREGES